MDDLSLDLFPGIDLGERFEHGADCAKPIGRRPVGRRPRPRTVRARRPSTSAALAELRTFVRDELGNLTVSLRRIEHHTGDQAVRRASDSELLELLLRKNHRP